MEVEQEDIEKEERRRRKRNNRLGKYKSSNMIDESLGKTDHHLSMSLKINKQFQEIA